MLMGSDIPLLAVRQQIASGIDLMVHLGRLRDKKPQGTGGVGGTGDERRRNSLSETLCFLRERRGKGE